MRRMSYPHFKKVIHILKKLSTFQSDNIELSEIIENSVTSK
jgi:hypothetical protein